MFAALADEIIFMLRLEHFPAATARITAPDASALGEVDLGGFWLGIITIRF